MNPNSMSGISVNPQSPNAVTSYYTHAVGILTNILNDEKNELRLRCSELEQSVNELGQRCARSQVENARLYEDNTRLSQGLATSTSSREALTKRIRGLENKLKTCEDKLRVVTQEGQLLLQSYNSLKAFLHSVPSDNRVEVLWNQNLSMSRRYEDALQQISYFQSVLNDGVQKGTYVPYGHQRAQNPNQPLHMKQPQITNQNGQIQVIAPSGILQPQFPQTHTIPYTNGPIHPQLQPQSTSNPPPNTCVTPAPRQHDNSGEVPISEFRSNSTPLAPSNVHISLQQNNHPHGHTEPQPTEPHLNIASKSRRTSLPHVHSTPTSHHSYTYPPHNYTPSPAEQRPVAVGHSLAISPQHLINSLVETHPALAPHVQRISGTSRPYPFPGPQSQTSLTQVAQVGTLPTPHPVEHVPQYALRAQQPQSKQPEHFAMLSDRKVEESKFVAPPALPTPPQSHKSMTPERLPAVEMKQFDFPAPVGELPTSISPSRNEKDTVRETLVGTSGPLLGLKRPPSESPLESVIQKRPRLESEDNELGDKLIVNQSDVEVADSAGILPNVVDVEVDCSPVGEPFQDQGQSGTIAENTEQPTPTENLKPISGEQMDAIASEENEDESDDEPQRGPNGLYKELDVVDWLLVGTCPDEDFGEDGIKICVLCRERVRNKQQVPQYQFVHPSDEELLAHFRNYHNTAFTSAQKEGPTYVR